MRLYACKKCGTAGGPTTLSKHYALRPSHKPKALKLKHKAYGLPKTARMAQRRNRKKKTKGAQWGETLRLVPDPDMIVAPTKKRGNPTRSYNYCPHCGTRLAG